MTLSLLLLAIVFFGLNPPTSLNSCLEGDAASLRTFVRHFTPIFRYRARLILARRSPTGSVATDHIDDLVQRTFEVLFRDNARALRQYDPDRGMSLENYLGRIASRESQNYVQKLYAQKRGGGGAEVSSDPLEGPIAAHPGQHPDPESDLSSRQDLERLEVALLRRLSPKGRVFFKLMYIEGLSPQELIDGMNVSRDTVYSWRKRIKAALTEALAEVSGLETRTPSDGGRP